MKKIIKMIVLFLSLSSVAFSQSIVDNRHLNVQREEGVVVTPGYIGHVFCENCPKRSKPEKVKNAKRIVIQEDTTDIKEKAANLFENISSLKGVAVINVKKNMVSQNTENLSPKWNKIATIYFKLNSYSINPQEKEKIINVVQQYQNRKFKIEGYTCDIGSERYNDWLATRRAEQVASEIEKISGNKPSIEGRGKCCYVSDDKRKNRRAEILIKEE